MSMDEVQLSARDVSCVLGGKRILKGVDIELKRGEITVVLGASGAGKSTLLRTIAGFEPVSAGEIRSGGQVLSAAGTLVPPEKRRIGIVMQSHALFPHMTALDNVRFGMDRTDSAQSARDWLAKVNLADRADAYPHELSGGEQQRVALARALASSPEIVLLDEAFSSLDQQLRKSVRRDARALLRDAGGTVLAVTHDPDEAMDLADTIVVLDDGKVLQSGTPEDLYWRPSSLAAARLLGEVNELDGAWTDAGFETAFGFISAARAGHESAKSALVRPSAISAVEDNSGPARVIETSLAGGQTQIVLQAENGGILRLSGAFRNNLEPGMRARILFDHERTGWSASR